GAAWIALKGLLRLGLRLRVAPLLELHPGVRGLHLRFVPRSQAAAPDCLARLADHALGATDVVVPRVEVREAKGRVRGGGDGCLVGTSVGVAQRPLEGGTRGSPLLRLEQEPAVGRPETRVLAVLDQAARDF